MSARCRPPDFRLDDAPVQGCSHAIAAAVISQDKQDHGEDFREDVMDSSAWLDFQMMILRGQPRNPLASSRRAGSPGFRVRPRSPALVSGGMACKILEMIAAGRLTAGSSLPSERRLAEAAKVSRVSVRAALSFLKQKEILTVRKGGGTCVTLDSESRQPIVQQLRHHYASSLAELAEIAEMLLPWAAARAADGSISSLELLEEGDGNDTAAAREFEFLVATAAASGSPLCEHMFRSLSRPLSALCSDALGAPTRTDAANDLRTKAREITEAVARRDAEAAGRAATHYTGRLKAALQQASAPREMEENEILAAVTNLQREYVAEQTRDAILSVLHVRHLAPGARLPGERALADQLGVSRISVRAALKRLRGEGWIETSARSGTRFVERKASPDSLVARSRSSPRTLRDLCDIRAVVEPWVVRRAATRDDKYAMIALKRAMTDAVIAHRPQRLKSNDDMRFHLSIARLSGSPVHLYMIEVTRETFADYFDYSRNHLRVGADHDHECEAHHAAIVRHIEKGEPEQAALWQREHSRVFQQSYSELGSR